MKNFDTLFADMKANGMPLPSKPSLISITGAKAEMLDIMAYLLDKEDKKLVELPEYSEVGEWLENNGQKGLFMYGTCGQGKTLLARYVIPAMILKHTRKIVKCYDINDAAKYADEILQKKIVAIDDIGTEEIINVYGNKRQLFAEIVDIAEKNGNLIILTSNLDKRMLTEKYGERVMDRLAAITKRVMFNGKSLR